MPQDSKKNLFVRILIVLYVVFLLVLVSVSFWKGQPPFNLSASSSTLLLLVTLLILSEAFDNLSLGKMLSLSREVKKKEQEVTSTKKENYELRDNIIKISSMVSQSQSNMTINGVTPELLQLLGVTKAKDKAEYDNYEEDIHKKNSQERKTPEDEQKDSGITRWQLMPYVEKESVKKYLDKFQISESELIWEVQFTPVLQGLDPIMERRIIFDAYLKTPQKELFFEVKFINHLSPMILNSLYVLLSKILFYRKAKTIKAELVLLLVDVPTLTEEFDVNYSRFIEAFQPAIANDLLRIERISFSEEDLARWKDELNMKQMLKQNRQSTDIT